MNPVPPIGIDCFGQSRAASDTTIGNRIETELSLEPSSARASLAHVGRGLLGVGLFFTGRLAVRQADGSIVQTAFRCSCHPRDTARGAQKQAADYLAFFSLSNQ